MMPKPDLSIVIPTHNRCAQLMKTLSALARQSYPATEFEVLVVADACEDGTADMINEYARSSPYHLSMLAHAERSAARTRNAGAANAGGSVLLFLDDDVVPHPELLRAHMRAQFARGVILGYSKPMVPTRAAWFHYDARRWWEDTYCQMAEPGHRYTYRDFFSGNVSMSADLFHEVGGFDTTFNGRLEDYELGLRMLKAGAQFRFEPAALGYHYDNTDLATWLRRVRQEGVADVQIGQRHPEMRPAMFAHYDKLSGTWGPRLRDLAFSAPLRGAKLERFFLWQASLCERYRLRRTWRRTVNALRKYNYWRGVGATLGDKRALATWLQEVPAPPGLATDTPSIDLAALPPAEQLAHLLDEGTRKGVCVQMKGVEVLAMPPLLGAEPLRLEHLHAAVRALAQRQFIPALALALSKAPLEVVLC